MNVKEQKHQQLLKKWPVRLRLRGFIKSTPYVIATDGSNNEEAKIYAIFSTSCKRFPFNDEIMYCSCLPLSIFAKLLK